MFKLIDRLFKNHDLEDSELKTLLTSFTPEVAEYSAKKARELTENTFGKGIFIRGLIEFGNFCKNDCYYCGIRRSNRIERYRLSQDEILAACENGYNLGFRTFVLQSGEDGFFTDDILCEVIRKIKQNHPDCALTLSIGERSFDSYLALKDAGADRFLLRHETATKSHYELLHPHDMSYENRLSCLKALKDLGYQVGCGIMVGSPYQDDDCIVRDLRFMKDFKPHMIGIGPFIPSSGTPFANKEAGSVSKTLFLLSILRLMHPQVLLPATTALGSLEGDGIKNGLLCGTNVVMPNLTPMSQRSKYAIYDNKQANDLESLKATLNDLGLHIEVSRGDSPLINI